MTGFACNNNCLICSLSTIKKTHINRTTEEIFDEIAKGKKEGFNRIEFTGGEVSIRNDIFRLIGYAKQRGFKEIGISTNGRIFCNKSILERFIASGLNRLSISLHGPTPKIHDAITRTPGSFEQTVAGIKNIKACSFLFIEVNSVILKTNFSYLGQLQYFIFCELGMRRWVITDLIPDGNILPFYKNACVRLFDLSVTLDSLIKKAPKNSQLTFFDFPLCLFSKKNRNSNNNIFIVAQERNEIAEQRGFNPVRIKKVQQKFTDKHKQRTLHCRSCIFDARCGGVWSPYLQLFGAAEILRLAHIHQTLKPHA